MQYNINAEFNVQRCKGISKTGQSWIQRQMFHSISTILHTERESSTVQCILKLENEFHTDWLDVELLSPASR